MRVSQIRVALALTLLSAQGVAGQFSSDIPGVPRAMLPQQGSRQSRWELEAVGFRSRSDTLAGRFRLGFGRSYRVGSLLEIGYDLTLAEGLVVRPPGDSTPGSVAPSTFSRGTFGYGLRLGGKLQPISYVSPEGYGYAVAIGAAVQPALRPLWAVAVEHDSTSTGGLIGPNGGNVAPRSALVTEYAAMASYRSPRVLLDLAVLHVGLGGADTGLLPTYAGMSVKGGALYRVLPGLALGGSWWGHGEPPWRDRTLLRAPTEKTLPFAVDLALGARPEAGTDLMIVSPTGDFTRSVRLYVRGRSTF